MKLNKIVILGIILCFTSCSKQFTFCQFYSNGYMLDKVNSHLFFLNYNSNFDTILYNNFIDSINKGYSVKLSPPFYGYSCNHCSEYQQYRAKLLGGYCVSN